MQGDSDPFQSLSDEMVLAIIENWEEQTIFASRLVCCRWNTLVQDSQYLRKRITFCKELKDEFERNVATLQVALTALSAKLRTYGDEDLDTIADGMFIVTKEMDDHNLPKSLDGVIASLEEACTSWETRVRTMNKRTKAKATLAESTARVLVYLSETVLINQIDINPFEVEVPFSKTLVPTVKKLLTFVTVTDADWAAAREVVKLVEQKRMEGD